MQILVVHEKHGDRYFNTNTDEALEAAALEILRERNEMGYYDVPDELEPPGMTRQDIDGMGASPIRDNAIRFLDSYDRLHAEWDNARRFYHEVQDALSKDDGAEAWKLLRLAAKSRDEYHGVKLMDVRQPLLEGEF